MNGWMVEYKTAVLKQTRSGWYYARWTDSICKSVDWLFGTKSLLRRHSIGDELSENDTRRKEDI